MSDSISTAPVLVSHTDGRIEEAESVVIRFAGDSGDGMQLTGTQFTDTAAIIGNDISTMPDFPAEIRAPAGTLAGVSGFQVHFSSRDIYTPGDAADVLVAMNPAALKAALSEIKLGGTIIANSDEFKGSNLKKAGYEVSPLEDNSLARYKVIQVPLTTLNRASLKDIPSLTTKQIDRSKNMFALGLTFWIYERPLEATLDWISAKFKNRPEIIEANHRSLRAGYHFGETTEAFQGRVHVAPAVLPAGTYRKITGNEATAIGMVTAAQMAGKPLVYCSYPITPASDILHSLAALKNFDVRTFQAEDEIAAMGAAIGAAFGGAFAATGTSGPGIALKSEAMNLAIVLELPMVIVDVQRGGPSTGLPTKPEQSDLLQVLFGRNGESPIPVVAPATPSDCFDITIEAFRMAVRAMTPVIVLSDGFLANSSEPWAIPDPDTIEPIHVLHPSAESLGVDAEDHPFLPYARDEATLARPWAVPGTAGLEHRIGGLSKQPGTGNVSYAPEDHQQMVTDRADKIAALADMIPELAIFGDPAADLLVLSWGGTYGTMRQAVIDARAAGLSVAHAHLRHLNPFPRNLEAILAQFERVLVPEINGGQLSLLIQGRFLKPVSSMPNIRAQNFRVSEVVDRIRAEIA
jgi:2-oxoglutarate ferredoxin oxidoreductase subunit alpha